MLPSLGYVDELTAAGERGERETRSAVTPERSAVERTAADAIPGSESVSLDDEMAGADGVSYVFSTPDGDRYVLKAASADAAGRMRRGAAIYDRFAPVEGVPVPAVYDVEPGGGDLSYPYTVVEYVEGDELTSISQFEAFSRAEKRTLVREMGRVLGQIHTATSFDSYGSVSFGSSGDLVVADGVDDWAAYYRDRYESAASRAEGSPVAALAAEAAEFFVTRARDLQVELDPVLLHGDFTPDNLIIEDGRIQAVLDWVHASVGCRAKELWEVEENVVNILDGPERRSTLRAALVAGYRETAPVSERLLALKQLFAVGEFSRIGGAHSAVTEVLEEFDTTEFQRRAEQELAARRSRADSHLEQLRA